MKNPVACDTAVVVGRYWVNNCDRALTFTLTAAVWQGAKAQLPVQKHGDETLFMAAINQCYIPVMNMMWNTSFNCGVGGVFFSLAPSGGSVSPAPCKWCLVHALYAGRWPGSAGCPGWPIGSAGSPAGSWLQGRSGAGSGPCRASGLEVCLGGLFEFLPLWTI